MIDLCRQRKRLVNLGTKKLISTLNVLKGTDSQKTRNFFTFLRKFSVFFASGRFYSKISKSSDEPQGAQWTGWGEKYNFLGSKEDGFVNCQNACGDMRTKKRDRICSGMFQSINHRFETWR